MNRFLVLVFALSACTMAHRVTEDSAADDDAGDVVLVIVDGAVGDAEEDAPIAEDAVPEDAAADAPIAEDAADAAIEDGSADSAIEDAPDVPAEDAPIVDASNPCTGGEQWCDGRCVWPMLRPSMCGTSCSSQVCDTGQICEFNQPSRGGVPVCCSEVGTVAYVEVTGHPTGYCSPSMTALCPGGACVVSTSGPDVDHGYFYCCPPSP